MLNRILFLLLALGAPASAFAMLYFGAQPIGLVTLVDRLPCGGLGVVALALGVLHARVGRDSSSAAEAAMWFGVATFLFVAVFTFPAPGAWFFALLVTLAGTSVVRLAERVRVRQTALTRLDRRIFA